MAAGPFKPGPIADVAAALERERPDLQVTSIEQLGEGAKSVVWRVRADGPDDFALKVFRPEYVGFEQTELAFHETLGDRHVNLDGVVPNLLFSAAGATPMIATAIVSGEQLLNVRDLDEDALRPVYRRLGDVLRRMHEVEIASFGTLPLPIERTIETNSQYMTERWLHVWERFVHHGGNRYIASRIRRYLEERVELWDTCGTPRLCHGDAHPGNLLIGRTEAGASLTGLLDFELAAAADPVLDFASATTSLVARPESRLEAMIEGHGEPEGPWRERMRMYNLIFAMSDWSFYATYVARAPQRECERRMLEITDSSRLRVRRSAAKRRLTGLRGRGSGG